MKNIKIINETNLLESIKYLSNEHLVAFPTETVYGLGADATSDKAVASIFSLKNRPQFNPLISHVHSEEAAFRYGRCTTYAKILSKAFWPGPLTMIFNRTKDCNISYLACSGLDSVALRVPSYGEILKLLKKFDKPLAAPSANKSGKVSPTSAQHVYDELGNNVKMILDGGETLNGIESTVIDIRGEDLICLRPGPITEEMIEEKLNLKVKKKYFSNNPESPGQLRKHYSPNAKIVLNSLRPSEGSAYLGFKDHMPKNFEGCALNLSSEGNIIEAASNLFKMLRKIDQGNPKEICIAPIPSKGIGEAINDRLKRASS